MLKFIITCLATLSLAVKSKRKVDAPVHLGGYSDSKHIQITCDQSWVEPKWGSPDETRTTDKEVYIADDDRLYTFNENKVSCSGCRK